MTFIKRIKKICFNLTIILFFSSIHFAYAATSVVDKKFSELKNKAPDLDPKVLRLALTAYEHARSQGLDQRGILSVIDYSEAANKKRFWVFDVNHNKLLFNTLVSHGKNSGSRYATHFSNTPNSRASSIGLYVTKNTYYGNHGYSLRLSGLDKGYNDNAFNRAIVVHGAWYVNDYFATRYGMIAAEKEKIITAEEAKQLSVARRLRSEIIAVDDFSQDELERVSKKEFLKEKAKVAAHE